MAIRLRRRYYNNPYIGVNRLRRGIGSNSLLVTESRAMMNYNALQAVLRQRDSHGLEYTLNYTYGKAHDQQPGQLCAERQWIQRRFPELL